MTETAAPSPPPAAEGPGAATPGSRIAVFDVDGTLTRSDTYLAFLLRTLARRPHRLFYCGLLPLALAAFKLKLRDNSFVKERFGAAILGGMSRAAMDQAADGFLDGLEQDGLRPQAVARIQAHQAAGDRVVIATASFDAYINQLGARLGVDDVIATHGAWDARGRFTGHIDGRNCYGAEKLRRVQAVLGERPAAPVTAYSDHHADIPLLRWADEAFAVNPTAKLVAAQAQTGATIVDWDAPQETAGPLTEGAAR